jgi:hypothetical protein
MVSLAKDAVEVTPAPPGFLVAREGSLPSRADHDWPLPQRDAWHLVAQLVVQYPPSVARRTGAFLFRLGNQYIVGGKSTGLGRVVLLQHCKGGDGRIRDLRECLALDGRPNRRHRRHLTSEHVCRDGPWPSPARG